MTFLAFPRRAVALMVSTVLAGTVLGLLAQHQNHPSTVTPLVDGSKNPALISDQTAIKIFVLSISEPPDATTEQLSRLKAKLLRVGLSDRDTATLIAHVTASHGQLVEYQAQGAVLAKRLQMVPDETTKRELVGVQMQIERLAASTYSSILAGVSPDGAAKLGNHISYIKTKIKIIPPPKM